MGGWGDILNGIDSVSTIVRAHFYAHIRKTELARQLKQHVPHLKWQYFVVVKHFLDAIQTSDPTYLL